MKGFLECCAGIDIGKREVTVTVPPNEEPKEDTRPFDTTVAALTDCRDWLRGLHRATVVVESTGSYWIPVWNVLREGSAVIVANPEHVKALRGEKTDPEDSRRLAERLRVGDIRGSFVPSEEIQQLRELTRRRKRVLGNANSERNRIQKLLERANASDVEACLRRSRPRIRQRLMRASNKAPFSIQLSKFSGVQVRARGHRCDHVPDDSLARSSGVLEKQLAELTPR